MGSQWLQAIMKRERQKEGEREKLHLSSHNRTNIDDP